MTKFSLAILTAVYFLALSGPGLADDLSVIREKTAVCDPNLPSNCLRPNSIGGLPGSGGGAAGTAGWGGGSATGNFHNFPIGTVSGQVVGLGSPSSRQFLDLSGMNTTVTIWCNLTPGQSAIVGPVPVASGGASQNDSFPVLPGSDNRWENSFAPAGAVTCVASQATLLYGGGY